MSEITKSQIRQSILRLFQIRIAQEDTGTEHDIHAKIMEQKFNALDIACSALQDNADLNIEEAIKKKESAFSFLHDALEKNSSYVSIINQIETSIDKLLELVFQYNRQEKPLRASQQEAQLSSFRQLNETVYVANGQLEAESIRLFLDSFGIPARVSQESAGIVLGLTVGLLGEADVKVSEKDTGDSRCLLQAMKNGLFTLPDELEKAEEDYDQDEIT